MILGTPTILFAGMAFSLSLGAFGALGLYRYPQRAHWWGAATSIVGSIFGILSGWSLLSGPASLSWQWAAPVPFLSLAIQSSSLSAFFMLTIGVIAAITSIYNIHYLRQFYDRYNLAVFMFFYNLFILSLFLVVTASHAIFFLLVWELMSLTSYFLVIFEHRQRRNIRSGLIYFAMTHLATAFLVVMFFTLANHAGSFAFADFQSNAATLSPFLASLIFILAVIGFGTKAGIIPFHVWLPEAHPAAPSSVSALMSGVMIKTGIFMLIRVAFTFLPEPMLWWGILVLILATISSLLGVLYALTEHDIKRLLAYHSIENIGIILLGVGAALVFQALHMTVPAVISLVAALYHTMNHAIFKTLLFFGAGAVVNATGTRNMERYGGLVKRLPVTALSFLVGSLAISGIVPFNGFVSEWLTFQSLFAGLSLSSLGSRSVFLIAAGALAFTSGLAAACFVKVFGVTFLARPRALANSQAREAGLSMQIAAGALAVLCLIGGIFPRSVIQILSPIARTILGTNISFPDATALPAPAMIAVLGSLVLGVTLAVALTSMLSNRQKTSLGPTWNCGTPLTPRMEITATGFATSLITVFRGVLRPSQQDQAEYQDASMRYLPPQRPAVMHMRNLYAEYLYRPVVKAGTSLALQVARMQSGNTNAYVLYMFIVVVGLLIWVTR